MVHHTMSIAHPYISELMIFWTKLKVVWRMTLQTKVCFALLHEIKRYQVALHGMKKDRSSDPE